MINLIDDKFLLASILQKSIRRGLPESARQTAAQLFTIDKNYLMYRSMIIAFEDIGVANPILIKDITQFKWGVRKFKERQIDFCSYFENLAVQMADSNKDRTACDSTYLIKLAYLHRDAEVLEHPIVSPVYNAWRALGNKRYPLTQENKEDNLDFFLDMTANQETFSREEISSMYSTQVEPFFIAIPFLEHNCSNLSSNPVGEIYKEVPLSALDGHTSIGKSILRDYARKMKNSFSLDQENLVNLLKMCLFRVEGQVVTPRLDYDKAIYIKKIIQQKELFYKFPHIPWSDYVSLGKELKQDLPLINDLRKKKLDYYYKDNYSSPKI